MKKFLSVLLVLTIVLCIGFVLTGCDKEDKNADFSKLSNSEFLSKVNSWEQEGNPSIKMNFNSDGTGKITTNGKDWRDITWFYDEDVEDILMVKMQINSRELIVDWMVKFNKENTILELVDLNTETKINYVKAGSQNTEISEQVKDDNLVGVWYSNYHEPTAKDTIALSLQKDENTTSGKGRLNFEQKTVSIDTLFIDWYVDGNNLKVILPSGVINEYNYKLNGEKIELYKDERLINAFEKTVDVKIEDNY